MQHAFKGLLKTVTLLRAHPVVAILVVRKCLGMRFLDSFNRFQAFSKLQKVAKTSNQSFLESLMNVTVPMSSGRQ